MAFSIAISSNSRDFYTASLLDHAVTVGKIVPSSKSLTLLKGQVIEERNFGIGNAAPTVTQVLVNNTAWTQEFSDHLAGQENLILGYSIPFCSSEQMQTFPLVQLTKLKFSLMKMSLWHLKI